MFQIVRHSIVGATLAFSAFGWITADAAESVATDCGGLTGVADLGGLMDYRLRTIDSRVEAGISQVNRYHTEPARRALRTTPTSLSIIADLDFTLRHSPNHIEALRLLMDYEHAGGRPGEYAKLECYLLWARQFAPTDMSVLQLMAQYYWKGGNEKLAEELYTQALTTDPNSAELHYNAGLFYFSQKKYPQAREHARTAYSAGYPLPGLRMMLERVNQWNEPRTGSAPPTPSP
jgi:hypothetical protein